MKICWKWFDTILNIFVIFMLLVLTVKYTKHIYYAMGYRGLMMGAWVFYLLPKVSVPYVRNLLYDDVSGLMKKD